MNFVAQELKPKEKIYLVNKLHASCRLSHSAHVKTLRKTIIITKEKKYQRRFFGLPGAVVQELSIYLFKKNMNRKILLLGKERDAHFDFPFISCRIADGGLTLPRRKKAVQYYVGTYYYV